MNHAFGRIFAPQKPRYPLQCVQRVRRTHSASIACAVLGRAIRRAWHATWICLLVTTCQMQEESSGGVTVPPELLGVWGLTETEKSKNQVEVIEFLPTRIVVAGVYFDLAKIETQKFTKGTTIQSGSIYTQSPGKPGLFSQYRITRVTSGSDTDKAHGFLYLDGGDILYGGLTTKLSWLYSNYAR